jgi:cyanophycinase
VSLRLARLVLLLTVAGFAFSNVQDASAQEIAEPPGSLLLVGGRHQDLPNDLRDLFFELAGGTKARIVVIPTAVADAELRSPDKFLKPWIDLKPLSVQVLHTRDPKKADDPTFVKPITEATAVFFTNGHRHRILDAYRGTLVQQELKKLQSRGGLIGGTGSGTAVLCDLVSNRDKEDRLTQPGLGLLPGFLIDDDGSKGRFAEAAAANPAYVGLALDPGTAVEIRGKNMRVVGAGSITVRMAKGAGQEEKVETLKSGAKLDLMELRHAAATRSGKQK